MPAMVLSRAGARVVESGPGGQDLPAGAWQRLEALPDPRSRRGRIYPRLRPARRRGPHQSRLAFGDRHDAPFRNSTSSVSGRYPGAGAGRVRAAACRVCAA